MDVLIDANVIINFITGRDDPFQKTSVQIIDLCSKGRLNGYVAFHSLSDAEARYWLGIVCEILEIAVATREQVMEAIAKADFRDFEDCLQDKCAQNVGAEYLVTCNIRDFRCSQTRAVTPDEMLDILCAATEQEEE